jgi:hypothetical protein
VRIWSLYEGYMRVRHGVCKVLISLGGVVAQHYSDCGAILGVRHPTEC